MEGRWTAAVAESGDRAEKARDISVDSHPNYWSPVPHYHKLSCKTWVWDGHRSWTVRVRSPAGAETRHPLEQAPVEHRRLQFP